MARVHDDLDLYPTLKYEIEELGSQLGLELRQVLVNRLEPGHSLDVHKDGPPDDSRWHLPVITHPLVTWWDEINGVMHMERGWWYGPVPYSGYLHAAYNYSPHARLHVIADFVKDRYCPET